VFLLIFLAFAASGQTPVQVNRAVPKVEPPKTELSFSGSPSVQEIGRARVFEEGLVPIGGSPTTEENSALAAALLGYAKRSGPDDFASLTGFLERHPQSSCRASLLTGLGLEYYNTAHYSLALDAWQEAWALAKDAPDRKAKAIADRAGGELAFMYARLGRMTELEALLKSVEGRTFIGPATERITGAREGLWSMQNMPEVSFKCGPYALLRILVSDQKLRESASTNAFKEILDAASTRQGFSLPQVAELSRKAGLNYQMAFRAPLTRPSDTLSPSDGERDGVRGDFIVPSVVHWRVGHYAAMVRQVGDRYLMEDPTFGNTVWATRQALEAETSGYFLIPPGDLPRGWRRVDAKEGASVWGKGITTASDPKPTGPDDPKKPTPCDYSDGGSPQGGGTGQNGSIPGGGMAVSTVHLMLVSLNINDTPVGYSPPIGPAVQFTVRYNQREAFQPANFTYSNFGPKWTCDWISYITDNPSNTLANVNYYIRGGGTREFSGFSTNSQSFAFQRYDQTLLQRTGVASYEMTWANGAKFVFSQPDGSVGTSRKVFLTKVMDPSGNAASLTYDSNLRIMAITDAIGQVTTLTYGDTNDIYKITRVTDPFGRFASFDYDSLGRLTNITDVIGLTSRFVYESEGDFINSLITPYGTNTFIRAEGGGLFGTTRSLETVYADGSRDRVEFNQSASGIPPVDPLVSVPTGMAASGGTTFITQLSRNTFYWSRTACASGYGDYTKARIYHWLHTEEGGTTASSIPESVKEPLENRVYYDYADQTFGRTFAGTNNRPTHIGRVLEDGRTQLYTYAYNGFGHVTNSIDPVGRTFSYLYATNGVDLLEVRQTRAGNNERLFSATYNAQHLPLTQTDAAGQTTTFTYNARGQLLTETNPKSETTTYTYDTNGYLIAADGPLAGTNDTVTATYDDFGRTRTKTDVSGYTLTFDYDDLDRLVKVTHPDSTFEQFIYNRLDMVALRDRAGRQTLFEFDNVRQMKKRTDPLGRTTLFEWCRCGSIKSLTDPMGRTTSWVMDVQGRPVAKQYGDGSQVIFEYENTSSRLRQVIDEKQQVSRFTYNRDDTLNSVAFFNATVPTPGVSYTYDPNYRRRVSMTDGTGTTLYSYHPVTPMPTLGANQLASEDGPLPNDTITYSYDALGRRVSTAINGVASTKTYDAVGRVIGETNALGSFVYAYDGSSGRLVSQTFPNGQTEERSYGNDLEDRTLQRITHKISAAPISEFRYGHDVAKGRITTWSQQAGTEAPNLFNLDYDEADQLLSATVTNAGNLISTFAYAYDFAGNRVTEQAGSSNYAATYNALNQINTATAPAVSHTNEWDAMNRLVAVQAGNQRTEFTYDGLARLTSIRKRVGGSEVSFRRFVWCDDMPCEERDVSGAVTKRFFHQGMKQESGPNAGSYFYTRDHLGSIRELTDSAGNIRARYTYDPFGRSAWLTGDIQADFGFTGLLSPSETGLVIARFRAYDPDLGRWLSRDPLPNTEVNEGANLYLYVQNNPVNSLDPLGLKSAPAFTPIPPDKSHCCAAEYAIYVNLSDDRYQACVEAVYAADDACDAAQQPNPYAGEIGAGAALFAQMKCKDALRNSKKVCDQGKAEAWAAYHDYENCLKKPCRSTCKR
jgi:RHS repeat-associated protein